MVAAGKNPFAKQILHGFLHVTVKVSELLRLLKMFIIDVEKKKGPML